MPFYPFGRGVAVELVTDIDEVLHRGDVDVIYAAEVEDDGFEGWAIVFKVDFFAAARAGIVPRAILREISIGS
jgi:hypothetical protein